MSEINLTKENAFILAHYTDDESFTLNMNNIGPHEVVNLIGHLAILLETREDISIEETAARLIADQGQFQQELQGE